MKTAPYMVGEPGRCLEKLSCRLIHGRPQGVPDCPQSPAIRFLAVMALWAVCPLLSRSLAVRARSILIYIERVTKIPMI